MSTIRKVFKVDGVLTDMTSVTLTNEAGTIGVIRTDTEASVVTAGTAMTKTSTGKYSHEFDDPAGGLTYTYWYKVVYSGETYYVEDTLTGPSVATGEEAADGSYIGQSDIESRFGTTNVAKWSNLDNTTTTADADRIEAAILYAEDYVENRFRNGPYALPFQAVSGTLYQLIDWCAKLAGIWLYEHRGLRDENAEGNLLGDMKSDVEREIDNCLAGITRLNAIRAEGDSPTAPVCV